MSPETVHEPGGSADLASGMSAAPVHAAMEDGESLSQAELEEVHRTAEEGPVTARSLFGGTLDLSTAHPHGSNILKKARDVQKSNNLVLKDLIAEIASSYVRWRNLSEAQICDDPDDPTEYVAIQARLYQEYRDVLDDERVDAFDSRGALQPSALEEFCYFLLNPLFASVEDALAIGHREVFQGLYFTSANFESFVEMPTPHYPTGNLDFVIGKQVDAHLRTERHESERAVYVPAVAVECKTYLDRPRWIESDILATNIKRGFPGCLYILLSEFLKLDQTKVNVLGSQIDKVYVLRRAKNVDRKIRRAGGTGLRPIHAPALEDFFCVVRDHLRGDWASPEDWEDSGVLK